MVLTKRQQKLLQPMVVYDWKIYHDTSRNAATGFFDDDPIMPVRIGPVMQSMVDKRLVERIEGLYGRGIVVYRLTAGTKMKYLCGCQHGKIVNEIGAVVGQCPRCYLGCLSTHKDSSF
ncbi:hypothetical protein D3C87_616270 [compost metagenome]